MNKEVLDMSVMNVPLQQDPHRVVENREKVLEVAIGREVRAYRRKQEITVAELSVTTGISIGMLSKIENGNTSPSLTTLQSLANALSIPLTAFFRRFEESRTAVHTKAGEGVELEREGTRANHQYNLLGHIGSNASGVIVEPYLITLSDKADTFPPSSMLGSKRSTCLTEKWIIVMATTSITCNRVTRCSLTPMPPTGQKTSSSCPRGIFP